MRQVQTVYEMNRRIYCERMNELFGNDFCLVSAGVDQGIWYAILIRETDEEATTIIN